MRGLKSTLVLLGILIGLGAYIYFVESKREPASEAGEKKAKVFSVEAGDVDEIAVKSSSGETTTLEKQDGRWMLTAPESTAADESEISSITTNLASLEVQRVVEEEPKDLAAYGLATPKVEVSFKRESDTQPRRLLLGDKTPTGGDLYAKLANEKRVFLVSGFLESTFDRKTFDLRDKSVLKFDRDKLDGLEIASEQQTLRFKKSGDTWRLTAPVEARADFGAVEGVIGRVSSGQMKAMAAPDATDLAKYGLDKPQYTVTLSGGSARAAISFGSKAEDGSTYAKDASRPMVFTVDSFVVDELKKPPSDFRVKDLFEFRTFSGNRFEIARAGSNTRVFEKKKGSDGNTEDWVQTSPAAKIDSSKIVDFLSKMSNLRAESFEDALPSGASEIATSKAVFSDGKKEERVAFFKAGGDLFATRPGEPGAAKLSASEYESAQKALDEAK